MSNRLSITLDVHLKTFAEEKKEFEDTLVIADEHPR